VDKVTDAEFTEGIELLVGVFNPYRWSQVNTDAYYALVRNLDYDQWMYVCKQASMNCEKMPTPKQLLDLNRNKSHSAFTPVQSCDLCVSGRIYFTYVSSKNNVHYERYGACSCEAGDKVARHMTVIGGISKEDAQFEAIRRRLVPYQAESEADAQATL